MRLHPVTFSSRNEMLATIGRKSATLTRAVTTHLSCRWPIKVSLENGVRVCEHSLLVSAMKIELVMSTGSNMEERHSVQGRELEREADMLRLLPTIWIKYYSLLLLFARLKPTEVYLLNATHVSTRTEKS